MPAPEPGQSSTMASAERTVIVAQPARKVWAYLSDSRT
jgi:hypothetical protein